MGLMTHPMLGLRVAGTVMYPDIGVILGHRSGNHPLGLRRFPIGGPAMAYGL